MELKEFFEHLYETEAVGAWRLGGVQWLGDRALRVTAAMETQAETPPVSRVVIDCRGVHDFRMQMLSHPHCIGELWMTSEHPLLDEYGDWMRLVADRPVIQPEKLFARFCDLVMDHYGNLSRVIDFVTGLDWRADGTLHCSEIACGPEKLMRELRKVARNYGAVVKLQPIDRQEAPRPTWVVGLSENWVLCDTATVIYANGELGARLRLGTPSVKTRLV